MLLTWGAVADHCRQEPRTQIASWVNGEACGDGSYSGLLNGGERKMRTCLHPERSADAEHSHEEHEGAESAWSVTVPWIADGTDNDNQDSGSKELGKIKVSDIGRKGGTHHPTSSNHADTGVMYGS